MGIKDILYTEKGKILSSVLASVLITTIIIVPITIFIDREIHKESKDSIYSYGFDAVSTSTGKRQDEWMGISGNTSIEQEATLLSSKENNYSSVTGSQEMFDGVQSNNGVAYLAYSNLYEHIEEVEGVEKDLSLLSITDSRTPELGFIDPIDSSTGQVSEDYQIRAPLDLIMRVPQGVKSILTNHMAIETPSILTIEEFNVVQDENGTGYGTWLESDKELKTNFAMAFIIFNYAAYSAEGHEALENNNLPVPSKDKDISAEIFIDWIKGTFGTFEESSNTWFEDIHKENQIFLYEVLGDGSATPLLAINVLFDSFNEKIAKEYLFGNLVNPVTFVYKLNNIGSEGAWETPNEGELPPGVSFNKDEYDGENEGTPGAFLGTMSKPMDINQEDAEITYWGYSEENYSNIMNGDEEFYNLDEFIADPDVPLVLTTAQDIVVFFTGLNTTAIDYSTPNHEVKQIKGITQEGYRAIYEFGTTWDELSKMGQLEF